MKLIHVTGLVVAVHAAVFVVIFATPGCRSTGRPKPTPEATAPTSVSPVLDALSPVAVPSESTVVTPVTALSPVVATPAPADAMIRFTPTRPSLAPLVEAPPVAISATHIVAKGDSLWSISRKYGISLDELAAANQLAKTASLRLGQSLTVPAKAVAPAAGVSGEAANTYAVASGDTLGSIARKHGTTAAALRTANNLKGDNLRIGQKLVLPGNSIPVSAPASTLPAIEAAPAARPALLAGEATHTVMPGDTLGSIARKHGVRLGDVATLNSITDPAKIRVGQTLKLPVGAKAAAAAKPAASAPASPAPPADPAPSPVTPVTPVTPVMPVTPVQPMAVPVIRID